MTRDSTTEDRLRSAYSLKGAIVVNCGGDTLPLKAEIQTYEQEANRLQSEAGGSYTLDDDPVQGQLMTIAEELHKLDNKLDDATHKALANEAARFLGIVLREGDHVGLGSGRAVAMTCNTLGREYLGLDLEVRLSHLKATTLTAFLSASSWATQASDCDAGKAAIELSKAALHCEVQVLALPIALPNADQEISQFHLPISIDEWVKEEQETPSDRKWRPSIAVIGVGVLIGGHRLLYATPERSAAEEILDRLIKEIQENYAMTTPPKPCPVCDLTNRLYFLPPRYRYHKVATPKSEETIKSLVEEIDPFLATVRPVHFRHFRLILMVAGGIRKAGAIRYFLKDPQFGFHGRTVLCTDSECARLLLSF